jgi:phosphopantetheinyl transferase
MMRFFCTQEELREFEPLELWVLKESYIKLFGKTLADIKNLRFKRKDGEIIPPDSSVRSRLYHIENGYAAISAQTTPGDPLPDSIEFF